MIEEPMMKSLDVSSRFLESCMYGVFTRIFCHIYRLVIIAFWQPGSASMCMLSALPLLSHLKKILHLTTSDHRLSEVCKWHLAKRAEQRGMNKLQSTWFHNRQWRKKQSILLCFTKWAECNPCYSDPRIEMGSGDHGESWQQQQRHLLQWTWGWWEQSTSQCDLRSSFSHSPHFVPSSSLFLLSLSHHLPPPRSPPSPPARPQRNNCHLPDFTRYPCVIL